MPNYMLLLHMNPSRPRPSSPDEIMAITKAYMDWADRMRAAGRLKGGEKHSCGDRSAALAGRGHHSTPPFLEKCVRDQRRAESRGQRPPG